MLYVYIFLFILFGEHRYLHGLTHSFPARRSSDLGHTPYVDEDEVAQQLEDGFSALAEAYSSILTNLGYSIPRDRNVLQFTRSQASEGKTTTYAVLARGFAGRGLRPWMFDADLPSQSTATQSANHPPSTAFQPTLLGHSH